MGETTAAAASTNRATYDVVVRPRAALVRSTALSIVFSAVPLAVAFVWVSFPLRLWGLVAAVVVVFAVLTGIVFARMRSAFVGLRPDGVTVHGVVTPNRTVARNAVDSLVVATTFSASVDRTTRELIALDSDGKHLFRMRADVWGDSGIDRVVDALGVQVTELGRPVSVRDFARQYPGTRAWYEQRAAYLVVGGVAALLVLGVLVVETTGLVQR